jgi:integrase/recombinase XerD
MLEELRRRNFADTTIRTYMHGVAHFSRYFRRPPDQLGPEDIRKYQAMLFTKLKYSPNTVILRLASLRFFYIHVLKRGWSIAETPYPKKVRHLPGVLSQEEVARLIESADTPFHRILLMTMYATGARRAETAHLKVSDTSSHPLRRCRWRHHPGPLRLDLRPAFLLPSHRRAQPCLPRQVRRRTSQRLPSR